jgi:hypothetical protein
MLVVAQLINISSIELEMSFVIISTKIHHRVLACIRELNQERLFGLDMGIKKCAPKSGKESVT